MDRDEILEQVREVVSDVFAVPALRVRPDSRFREDFGAERLHMMELSNALADQFEVDLEPEEVLDARNPSDLVDTIEDLLDRRSG